MTGNPTRAGGGDFFRDMRLYRVGGFVEPVFDQRHVAAHDFAQSRGDFFERADGFVGLLAAKVAKDDLLPAAIAPELKRGLH